MTVIHERDRSLVDTQTMAAVVSRSCWSVRAYCPREPGGYDVDACAAELEQRPEPVLVTAAQARQYLGLNAGTVRVWAHRGRLVSYGTDGWGRPLYDVADLINLSGS